MRSFLDRVRAPWRSGAARRLALDVPLGLLVLAFSAVFLRAARTPGRFPEGGPEGGPPWKGPGWGDGPPWAGADPLPPEPLAFACIWAVALAVALRRFYPRAAFAAAALGAAVFVAEVGGSGPILAGMVVTAYTMASLAPLRSWAPWTAAVLPLLLAAGVGRPYLGLLEASTYAVAVPYTTLLLAALAVGVTVRGRRENALQERREELRRSAYEERLRIAREVHDLVGHSLSVINMQAGVALHVLDKRPDRVRDSLAAIRSTSKDALEELRGTLAVFREGDGAAPAPAPGDDRAPLPGLDRLGELAARMESAGQRVSVHTEGSPVVPPAAVDHAAYRIVQEALTNALRHAPGAEARVRVGYERTEVVVEIENGGAAVPEHAEGSGIAGMRERARAVGGNLHAGPRPEGGFAVRARLPLGAPRSGR
ncbi:sensor histidine kinase [Nocardiopsis potens]|uniref:sensor histidine kinase n=1 Tax=Nocardiopsis potens TaxID=1246458 RepID=UPI00034AB20C|nr:sensor histidine kinase [Nocardiopsis potens]